MQPAQALIFDMDGLLLDTERLYMQATQEVVGPYGHTVTVEQYCGWIGREVSGDEFVATFPCDLPPAEFLQRMRDAFHRLVATDLTLRPGALAFVEGVARPYPKAIASSTRRETIDAHLRQTGLIEHFPIRVSGRDVARGKPAPDVFLEAARQLGVPPERCIVFEDSLYGVQGAQAAGMRAVAVRTEYTGPFDLSCADLCVDRLDEVPAAWIQGLGPVAL